MNSHREPSKHGRELPGGAVARADDAIFTAGCGERFNCRYPPRALGGTKRQWQSRFPIENLCSPATHCSGSRPRRLRYSWRGGNLDTTVTWTLTGTAGGTLVKLEQSGFGVENAAAFEALNRGWRSMKTGRLGEVLAELA